MIFIHIMVYVSEEIIYHKHIWNHTLPCEYVYIQTCAWKFQQGENHPGRKNWYPWQRMNTDLREYVKMQQYILSVTVLKVRKARGLSDFSSIRLYFPKLERVVSIFEQK